MTHASIWEAIDQLITVEFRAAGMNPGKLEILYGAARQAVVKPLCLAAAQRLHDCAEPGAPVVLITGAGGPPWLFQGETDGPLGLAGLARALSLGYGLWPVVITEARSEAPVTAALVAAGVSVLTEPLARAALQRHPGRFPNGPRNSPAADPGVSGPLPPARNNRPGKDLAQPRGCHPQCHRQAVDAAGRVRTGRVLDRCGA